MAETVTPATEEQLASAHLTQAARVALDFLKPHLDDRHRKTVKAMRDLARKQNLDPDAALRLSIRLVEIEELREDLKRHIRSSGKPASP